MNSPNLSQLLQTVEEAANATALADAVKALAEAQISETIPDLIRALNYNNPGAAVAAVDGLIALGKPSVEPLLALLDNYNYGARAWALRALSGIGDPRSHSLLVDTALNDFALSVRRAAARGLGTIQWAQTPPEPAAIMQQQSLAALCQLCHDPEWIVRYAAVAGLELLCQMPQDEDFRSTALDRLNQVLVQEPETAVKARARLAIERCDR
jgi:phycocyanobilin lyase subunit beta